MAHQVQVRYITEDGRSAGVLAKLHVSGKEGKKVTSVVIVDVYTIDAKLTASELKKVVTALHEPLSEACVVDIPLYTSPFSYAIEIGFLPGVTDNTGATTRETIADMLKKSQRAMGPVFASRIYFVKGKLTKESVSVLARALYNPLIQRAEIKSYGAYMRDKGMGIVLPRVTLIPGKVKLVDLEVTDEELATIGKKGIKNEDASYRGPLGLGVAELTAIRSYFRKKKRQPTDIEIETLAQTWSEHCKHTIFANPLDDIKDGIYKHYIKRATEVIRKKKGKNDFCVSVFSDNSGVIKFDKHTYITHKVETHNSPSALDPFGGAITGIVGVNRDTIGTGLGAKPLLNMYGYCLADPNDSTRLFRDKERSQELLSAKRIMDGVIEGVNAGGNQSGIPTPQGFTYFEKRYRGKPLVFVGTVGVLPKTIKGKPSYKKAAKAGDYIVMLGGRVGLDGIHGATFSSEALDSGSPATAVQIGDAITQKKFSDAIIKDARDLGLYNSITDNGAGGLSSSVGEMGQESGGCEVWLDTVPLKYPGLSPWQIWISESQERMTLAVPKDKWTAFKKLMQKHGSEATIVGTFTSSGVCKILFGKKVVMEIEMDFMHNGNPKHFQKSKKIQRKTIAHPQSIVRGYEKNLSSVLLQFIKEANIGSTEFISKQYDHEVQGVSVTKPLHGKGRVNASASVSRPHTDTLRGIVLSQGLCPRYSDIDTYHMAASAIDQAIRNTVAIGGDPEYIALLDNFCWTNSHDPERLYELKRAARACYDYAILYGAPFISGKDSMFNDFKGFDASGNLLHVSVPPTLLISSISVMPDITHSVTLDLKKSGDLIYVLGDTKAEMGASEFVEFMNVRSKTNHTGLHVPMVNAKKNMTLYKRYYKAAQNNLVSSAIGLDRGGLSVAMLKSAIGGQLGIEIDISKVGMPDLTISETLFSESNGRLLVSVASEKQEKFERMLKGSSFVCIGRVTDDRKIRINRGKRCLAAVGVKEATNSYRFKFKNY